MLIGIVGKPGSGKTTIAAAVVQKNKKKKNKYYKRISKSKLYAYLDSHVEYIPVSKKGKIYNFLYNFFGILYAMICQLMFILLYSKNFYDVIYSSESSIKDTVPITYKDLGLWKPTENSLFILEEAGVHMHGRDYKGLSKDAREFFCEHRHKHCDILIISQTPNYDKVARTLTEVILIARALGPFTWYHRIPYKIEVDKEKHDIVEGYYVLPFIFDLFETLMSAIEKRHRMAKLPVLRSQIIFRPLYYKHFNSYVDTKTYSMVAPDKLIEA